MAIVPSLSQEYNSPTDLVKVTYLLTLQKTISVVHYLYHLSSVLSISGRSISFTKSTTRSFDCQAIISLYNILVVVTEPDL